MTLIICFAITAGVAVLLTIITMFSTPILTAIFGDGSLEVNCTSSQMKFKKGVRLTITSVLNQEEDTEDRAHDEEPAVVEVTG